MINNLINVEAINFRQHILFKAHQEMSDLMQPITNLGIRHLCYQRIDADGGMVILANKPQLEEIFIREKFYLHSLSAPYDHYTSGYYLGNYVNFHGDHAESLKQFGFWHYLVLVQSYAKHTEIFYFGADIKQTGINHLYLNLQDQFENYALYFRQRSTALMRTYQSQRLFYPNGHDLTVLTNKALMQTCAKNNDIILSQELTLRELECLRYLKQGYTAKMIARRLNISSRTVEHHLAHIRNKLKVNSTKQLLIN